MNTSNVGIEGARVTVLDGVNAGQTTTTNSAGNFTFASLTIGNGNFSATASGFLDERQGTLINGTNSLTFTLSRLPNPPAVAAAITITSRIISGGGGSDSQEWGFVTTSTTTFTSYDWNFGDGASANGVGPEEQHLYHKGSFTVTVTGYRSSGSPVVGTLDISVE